MADNSPAMMDFLATGLVPNARAKYILKQWCARARHLHTIRLHGLRSYRKVLKDAALQKE